MEDKQLPFAHWLYSIPGIGSKTIGTLLGLLETPEKIYHLPESGWAEIPAFQGRKQVAEKILASRQIWDVQREYNILKSRGIHFTCLGHKEYPYKLSGIADAPFGIYYIGRLPEQDKPAVAIIGARTCSEYGRNMAYEFGEELGYAGIQVISGMARGIDGIGQKAALQAGGYSLAVLGCGVDVCYPAEHRELYHQLCEKGGVCSEYLPATMPQNRLFPPRNRIISGMADAVLVIEARKRSGTLITVDMALEQGREVYALPGKVSDALSDGCNRLIKQGAAMALSPWELLQEIWEMQRRQTGEQGKVNEIQKKILEKMEDTPQSAETIWECFNRGEESLVDISEIMNQLMQLVMEGKIRQMGNSYFSKS